MTHVYNHRDFDPAGWVEIGNEALEGMIWAELTKEHDALCQMLLCLNQIYRRKLHAAHGFRSLNEYLIKGYNLSKQQAWSRAAVARVVHDYPRLLNLLQTNEACLSHLAMIASRLTPANAEMLFDAATRLPKRELEAFLPRVGDDGSLSDAEETITVTLRLSLPTAELLDQVVALLSVNKDMVTQSQAVAAALDAFLTQRDPERKAARAQTRATQKAASTPVHEPTEQAPVDSQGTATTSSPPQTMPAPESCGTGKSRRQYLPQASRHEVFRRHGGRCCWQNEAGERCTATRYLQVDHIKMVAEGGDNSLMNLRILCGLHNRWEAERRMSRK